MKCHCLFFILHVNRSAMQRDSLISAINFYCQQWVRNIKREKIRTKSINQMWFNIFRYIPSMVIFKHFRLFMCAYIYTTTYTRHLTVPSRYSYSIRSEFSRRYKFWCQYLIVDNFIQFYTKYWMENIEIYWEEDAKLLY